MALSIAVVDWLLNTLGELLRNADALVLLSEIPRELGECAGGTFMHHQAWEILLQNMLVQPPSSGSSHPTGEL